MAGGGSGQRLVGRARPLRELEAALREAVAGRGALALVTGEAGIGKRPGAHLQVAEALLAVHGDDNRHLAELATTSCARRPAAGTACTSGSLRVPTPTTTESPAARRASTARSSTS